MNLTGNQTVDSAILTAEALKQTAISVAGTQAEANLAAVNFYKSVMAAKIAASPSLDVGCELAALENLGQSV